MPPLRFVAAIVSLSSLCFCVTCSFAEEPAVRVWRDQSGFFQLEGEIVDVQRTEKGPNIVIRRADNSVVTVPYALFSETDQQFSVAWYRQQQKQPAAPPKSKLPIVGDRVQIQYGNGWRKGEIVEIDGPKFRFRYNGYSATWDEWKTKEQLRWEDGEPVIVGGPSDPNADPDPQAPPQPESSPPADTSPQPPAIASADEMGESPESVDAGDRRVEEPNQQPTLSPQSGDGKQGIAASRLGRLPGIGDRVKIKWGNSWWKGEIVGIDADKYRFNYDGWDSYPDEWRTAEQLRWEDDSPVVPGGPADPKADPTVVAALDANNKSVGSKAPSMPQVSVSQDRTKPRLLDQVAVPPATIAKDNRINWAALAASDQSSSPFPKGLTPEQTFDYLKKQSSSGNLQVFWDWIPDEYRAYTTSQEQRDNLAWLDKVNGRGLGASHFLKELVPVLRDQKQFVLANPVIRSILEDEETIQGFSHVYEPATDLLEECSNLIGNIDDELRGEDFERLFRGRCNRIGTHLVTLLQAAPADQLESFWQRFVVTSQKDGGTLTLVYPTGEKKVHPLVRVNGRWMPRALAETFLNLPNQQRQKVAELRALSKPRLEGRMTGAGMARGMKDASYMSLAEKFQLLAAAETQEDFDARLQHALIVLQMAGFLGP